MFLKVRYSKPQKRFKVLPLLRWRSLCFEQATCLSNRITIHEDRILNISKAISILAFSHPTVARSVTVSDSSVPYMGWWSSLLDDLRRWAIEFIEHGSRWVANGGRPNISESDVSGDSESERITNNSVKIRCLQLLFRLQIVLQCGLERLCCSHSETFW